jgi:type I restriction enzyme S subunit
MVKTVCIPTLERGNENKLLEPRSHVGMHTEPEGRKAMNSANFLEKLLDGVGVEWKPLGDIAKKISSGGTPQTGVREYWEGGTIPWMSSGEVNLETIYKTENFITEAGLKNSSAKFVPRNSLVIALAGQGKTRGKIARTRIDLTTNQSLASITVDETVVNHDYLYHFLKTQYENLRQISSGSGTRGGLNLQMISNYKFPLPCPENPKKSLAIQAEIVRILDAFTALTAELTAELSMRKKQYNYYRDQLLSFEDGEVEWKALGEIGDVKMCKRILKNETQPEGDVPFYKIGTFGKQADAFISSEIYESYKSRYSFPKKGDVLISASGTIGRAVIYDGERAYFQDSNIVWLDNDESVVTNRYQ